MPARRINPLPEAPKTAPKTAPSLTVVLTPDDPRRLARVGGQFDEHLRQMHTFAEVAAKAKYKNGKRTIFFIHVVLNPIFKSIRKYLLQLGFLDGYYGFVFCATTSALNFYKYLRLYEYHRSGLPEERLK